jgi:hypothetical protein
MKKKNEKKKKKKITETFLIEFHPSLSPQRARAKINCFFEKKKIKYRYICCHALSCSLAWPPSWMLR